MIEQSDESLIITTSQLDPPGPQIVYLNPAFTKMTGYAPEEVIGKTLHILQGPKTDRSVLGQLRKDCAAGKVFQGEMINYRKDRSEIHLAWTAGPALNERGEVTHFAAARRDVTERRRIAKALRDSEAQLRAILDHRSSRPRSFKSAYSSLTKPGADNPPCFATSDAGPIRSLSQKTP